MDAHSESTRLVGHDGLGVLETCTWEARGTFIVFVAELWTGRHVELGPAIVVGERCGDDEWICRVGGVEGNETGAIDVVDVAEVGEPEMVDAVAGARSGDLRRGQAGDVRRVADRGHGEGCDCVT